MWGSRRYQVYKPSYSLLHMYIQLLAAIFHLLVTVKNVTLKSIRISRSVLLDPEHVGLAVGISSLSCLQAEIFAIT